MSDVSNEQLAAFHATTIGWMAPTVLSFCALESVPRNCSGFMIGAASSRQPTSLRGIRLARTSRQRRMHRTSKRSSATSLNWGLAVLSGEGKDPESGWAEQSLLAIGLSREQAVALGNRYRQLAIVFAGQDALPELVLLR